MNIITKLFWRLNYARHMNKRTNCGIKYGLYDASVFVSEFEEWVEMSPGEAADESISCWDADQVYNL